MKLLILSLVAILSGCAADSGAKKPEADAKEVNEALMRLLGGPSPKLTAEQQRKIEQLPLGSKENPVRAEGVRGEYQYLARLRCPEGKQPVAERLGSVGDPSPYGSIMDVYRVTCDAPPVAEVFIDMYHPEHVEAAPVPGFTIVPP